MSLHLHPKAVAGLILLGLPGPGLPAATAEDTPFPLVAAEECRPRDGLPNFLVKARTPGAWVTVAYLGGSITA